MMKLLTCTIIIALIAGGCGRESLDDVVRKHNEASGGTELVESVQDLTVRLRLSEPETSGEIRYRSARPGKARVDLTVGGRAVFSEGYDGTVSWQQTHGQPAVESTEEASAPLRRGAITNMYGLHELPSLGYTLELLDETGIEGIDYITLQIAAPDGQRTLCYLNPETYLLTRRRDVHTIHPGVEGAEMEVETVYSDFRVVDGILRPFRSIDRNLATGDVLQTVEIKEIATNTGIDPAVFAMPE